MIANILVLKTHIYIYCWDSHLIFFFFFLRSISFLHNQIFLYTVTTNHYLEVWHFNILCHYAINLVTGFPWHHWLSLEIVTSFHLQIICLTFNFVTYCCSLRILSGENHICFPICSFLLPFSQLFWLKFSFLIDT